MLASTVTLNAAADREHPSTDLVWGKDASANFGCGSKGASRLSLIVVKLFIKSLLSTEAEFGRKAP